MMLALHHTGVRCSIICLKEIDINHFKRGFGERNSPLRLWIWFEDHSEEILYIKEKLKFYEKN